MLHNTLQEMVDTLRVIKLDNRKNDDAVKALIEFVTLKTNDDVSEEKKSEDTKIIAEKS